MSESDNNKNPLIEFGKFANNCVTEKNPVPFIILTHLRIEQVLMERLYKRLELNLKKINKSSLEESIGNSHSRLLNLCHAIGIIKDNYLPAFKKLNKIRNNIAHRLEYEISETEKEEFAELIPDIPNSILNFFAEEDYDENEKKFRSAIIALYSDVSHPLYNKIKIPNILGTSIEVDLDAI